MTLTNCARLPKFRASAVFMDVDDTITHFVSGNGKTTDRRLFISSLVTAVARSHTLNIQEARSRVDAVFDFDSEPFESCFEALRVRQSDVWRELIRNFSSEVVGYPDAIEAIKKLHARGFRLFTGGTTNSGFACRVKLAAAGIADENGSPYFEQLLGGAEVHPAGKTSPEFYANLLRIFRICPEEAVHVGDSPVADLGWVREAGITQVVLPRRDQRQDWVLEPDGGLYVKSLTMLPLIIVPR